MPANHYDWLAWHGSGLQATGACRLLAPVPAELTGNSKWHRPLS